jgi:urease accessory protein
MSEGWRARLELHYRRDGERTLAASRHEGPLRVLKALYPEGDRTLHHVIVHPPAGIVGGDSLAIDAVLGEGCHALLTTPGATRWYRSAGPASTQQVSLRLHRGARLEWLPLETIAYRGCRAEAGVRFALDPGAEMIGWELLALGLPASGAPFDHGCFTQHVEQPGHWLDHGVIDGSDRRLLDSPLGLAGRRVLATMWFGAGLPIEAARREALEAAARGRLAAGTPAAEGGCTSPAATTIVVRVLADQVEAALAPLRAVHAAWRETGWSLAAQAPRVWAT